MKEALKKLQKIHNDIIFNKQKNLFNRINSKLNQFIKNQLLNMRLTHCILEEEEFVEIFEKCDYIKLINHNIFFDEEDELTIKLYFENRYIISLEYNSYQNKIVSFTRNFEGIIYR